VHETISPSDVYDKDLNFLFGSGASAGLFPTLALKINNDQGEAWTLEELATHFEVNSDPRYIPLFMHYYNTCIHPAQVFDVASTIGKAESAEVVGNYRRFLENVLGILQRRKPMERRCNLFTTNYDGCFPLIADQILRDGDIDFVLNDGARGFRRRYLQARNFNTYLCETGIFERHQTSIPQINLAHVHGSVYWQKEGAANIVVDYDTGAIRNFLDADAQARLADFSACLDSPEATLADLKLPEISEQDRQTFMEAYQRLPIVNPTKWKFHETVFEEHYYQTLRMLSYELEKPNAVLITFGFSFADEHILNLVKRSLSNPDLQMFVCCYSERTRDALQAEFKRYPNVRCLALPDARMDFTAFNERVFSLDVTPQQDPKPAQAANEPVIAVAEPNDDGVAA
jgi:hypothetical protein